jgi:hypothetical protein
LRICVDPAANQGRCSFLTHRISDLVFQ